MHEHLHLGTVAGVRVGVNASVLVIVVLLAVGVGAGQLPAAAPGRSAAVYAVGGIVAAVVFVASLLAHELAHARMAMRHGIEVEGITLWMLGGVARLRGEAPTPRIELLVAGVGPLVSAVLGIGFAALAWLLFSLLGWGIVTSVVLWLGLVNLVLAVFNLAPAAPLDGGRILRALLWARHGDPLRAAITAAGAGRVFGYLLVVLGAAQLVVLVQLAGLWLVLIGFFIVNAASAEGQLAQVREGLAGLRVAEVMTADPVTVPEHLSVEQAIDRYVFAHRFSSFPVVDADGHPTGLITLAHLKQVPRGQWATTSVRRVATPFAAVLTTTPDEPLSDLVPRLAEAPGGRVLVVVDGEVVGIVSPTDLARTLERSGLRREDRSG